MSDEFNFHFYPYEKPDKYGFWVEIGEGTEMSLYENTPDGGMWLDPITDGSDYGREQPSDALCELVGRLASQETVDLEPYQGELKSWESHFASTIHGTVNNKSPDNVPGLVWDWMQQCAEEYVDD